MALPPIQDAGDGVVSLDPDDMNDTSALLDPSTSISALASTLDTYDGEIPSFINDAVSARLPKAETEIDPSSSLPDLDALDKHLNELLTRLSLLSQDTSSALEQSIHDISRTVPRLTYDLQFMRESATSLQTSLQLVQERVSRQTNLNLSLSLPPSPNSVSVKPPAPESDSDEVRTHRSLEKLTHLDKLKTRMELGRDILREAESWSTLEGEITSYISSQSWSKAGNRLAEASKSMVVFQNTPAEYESRKGLLVSLQNELETALSAALKEALAKNDTEACGQFYGIFKMMERGAEFKGYYFASRRAGVITEWSKAVLLDATQDSAGEGTPIKFSVFLPRFYGAMLSAILAEREQIPLIFPPPSTAVVLSTFIQTIFDNLSPSLQSRLGSVADFYTAEALPELIRAYKSTEELARAIQELMEKIAFQTQGGQASGGGDVTTSPDGATPATKPEKENHLTRTRSRRLSLSRRFSRAASSYTETASSPAPWETPLYEPFLDLQTAYPSLERRYLSHQLRFDPLLIGPSSRNADDVARQLSERSLAAFNLAEAALARCTSFTHGYGAKGLVDGLNSFLEGFLDSQHDLLEKAGTASTKQSSAAGRDELDFEGLDYTTEDWGSFQVGLHVLSACREIGDRLSAFESKLRAYLVNTGGTLKHPEEIDGTTRGAITLLSQSPLNSTELHSLLYPPSSSLSTYPLESARSAHTSLTRTSQKRLQSIILAPLLAQLSSYPALPIWSSPEKPLRKGELAIPTFSLSPTDTVVQVSEGLLNLLRVFEVYAGDSSLGYSIETLPFIDANLLQAMVQELQGEKEEEVAAERGKKLVSNPASPSTPLNDLPPSHSLAGHVHSNTNANANGNGNGNGNDNSNGHAPPREVNSKSISLPPETVLSTWLTSLSLTLLSHFTSSTLPSISTLTTPGAKQLSSDLAYLSNAVRALDVEWEEMEWWRAAVDLGDEEAWRMGMKEKEKGGGNGSGKERVVWEKVGRMRGWQV